MTPISAETISDNLGNKYLKKRGYLLDVLRQSNKIETLIVSNSPLQKLIYLYKALTVLEVQQQAYLKTSRDLPFVLETILDQILGGNNGAENCVILAWSSATVAASVATSRSSNWPAAADDE